MASRAINILRSLLDHLDGEDRAQQLAFFHGILAAGVGAVPEVDGRLPGLRAPRALRQLALEASFYFPWPEWVPTLARLLRYETDLAIFHTGVRALGRIGTEEALTTLKDLNLMRQGAEFKELLAGVLAEADPREAFNLYLVRLMEGGANPGVANEAAQRLLGLVDDHALPALQHLTMHPDLLVFRHCLQLIAHVCSAEAAAILADLFLDSHREVLADRNLKDALGAVRASPPALARATAAQTLPLLDGQADPAGLLRAFFESVLAATEEGRPSQLGALVSQTAEAMHLRARRLGYAVDNGAEGLVTMALSGCIPRAEVLDLLVAAFREQTGREGLARALARLVPLEAQNIHQLILDSPDGAMRAAAVEILGERQEPALGPVLLRACRDPLEDIADRALASLGRLPGVEALARQLLNSSVTEDLPLALRLIRDQRLRALVPDLLALAEGTGREELAAQAVETLGLVGAPEASAPLLTLLHSGQSQRMQLVLGQALRALRLPVTALALCAKADELRAIPLHALALEALAEAHSPPGPALAPEAAFRLLDQARRVWNDRSPWPLRLRVVLALVPLQLEDRPTWQALSDLVEAALVDKRPPTAWTPEAFKQVQAAARTFQHRAAGG